MSVAMHDTGRDILGVIRRHESDRGREVRVTPEDWARMPWHARQKYRRRVAAERPSTVLHVHITTLPGDADVGRRIRHMARQIEPHIPRDPVDVIEQRREAVVAETSRSRPTGPSWRRSSQVSH